MPTTEQSLCDSVTHVFGESIAKDYARGISSALKLYCFYAGWENCPPEDTRAALIRKGLPDNLVKAVGDFFENKALQVLCRKNATKYAEKLKRRQAAAYFMCLLDGTSDDETRRIIYACS